MTRKPYPTDLTDAQWQTIEPALFLGYLKLLAAKELLDEMTPDEIRAAASQFTQKTKLCR